MRSKILFAFGSLIVLFLVVLSVTTFWNKQSAKQKFNSEIPITIKQLEQVKGKIPFELQCGKVILNTSDTLSNFSCYLVNNTDKNILAASVVYSIIVETNGIEEDDGRVHTIETYIHPDLYEKNKSIQPGGKTYIQPTDENSYPNSTIKGLEFKVEYVEFEDKTTLGSSVKGSQIIVDIREGAASYKNWLKQEYVKKGKSAEAIIPLLDKDLELPVEFKTKNSDQIRGAMIYRNRLLRNYEENGVAIINEYLSK